jgi:CcmD family protein
MDSLKYLEAAYLVTWVIHVTYLLTLVSRFKKLRKELDQLPRR